MSRKKPSPDPVKAVAVDEEPSPSPFPPLEDDPPRPEERPLPSKADAIREAIQALGGLSAPTAGIQSWIKDKYGLEVGVANIYGLKNKMKGGREGGRSSLPSSSSLRDTSLSLSDIRDIKALGSRLGWDNFKDLVEELSSL